MIGQLFVQVWKLSCCAYHTGVYVNEGVKLELCFSWWGKS